jgi:hypothetical protein
MQNDCITNAEDGKNHGEAQPLSESQSENTKTLTSSCAQALQDLSFVRWKSFVMERRRNRFLVDLSINTNNNTYAKVEHEVYDYAGNNLSQLNRNKRF